MNREPIATSAPDRRRPTNAGISCGSVEPSASSITMMSPVAAAKPARRAAPLPGVSTMTTLARGTYSFATATVSSVERPSTMISSWIHDGIRGRTCGRLPGLVQRRDHHADRGDAGEDLLGCRWSGASTGSNAMGAAATVCHSPHPWVRRSCRMPCCPVRGRDHPRPTRPGMTTTQCPCDQPVVQHSRPGWSIRACSSVVTVRAEISSFTASRVQKRRNARVAVAKSVRSIRMLAGLSRRVTRCPPIARSAFPWRVRWRSPTARTTGRSRDRDRRRARAHRSAASCT